MPGVPAGLQQTKVPPRRFAHHRHTQSWAAACPGTSYPSVPLYQAHYILPPLTAHALPTASLHSFLTQAHLPSPPAARKHSLPSLIPSPFPPSTPQSSTLRTPLYFGAPPPARARSDTLPPRGGRDSRAVLTSQRGKTPPRSALRARFAPPARSRSPPPTRAERSSAEPNRAEPCRAVAAMMPGRTIRKPAPPAAPAGRERRKGDRSQFLGGRLIQEKKHALSFFFSFFFFTFFFLSPTPLPGKDLVRIKCPSPCACFAERDAVAECALELRRIGDKADLQQKVLNLITKLFCPKT